MSSNILYTGIAHSVHASTLDYVCIHVCYAQNANRNSLQNCVNQFESSLGLWLWLWVK